MFMVRDERSTAKHHEQTRVGRLHHEGQPKAYVALLPSQSVSPTTPSGIPVQAVYTPADLDIRGFDYLADLGLPGEPPFTRGIDSQMYRRQLWIMGQYSGFGTAEETNRRFRYLLEQGQTGFSIALDLPTQLGLDSDSPLAAGEVGKVGVPIDSLRDMEILLDGIPLERVRQIRTSANAIGPIMLSLFLAVAEKKGVEPGRFRVMLQNDSLKEYFARGTYIFPPAKALKFSADVIEYCARHLPNWEPIEFCGYHIRDSGGDAVQEVAFALANGLAYLDEVLRRGLSIDQVAPSVVAFLSAHIDIFEEVAKFRAARRCWARLMRERYGSTNPNSMRLKIFCYTLGSDLTAQQPLNNIVRVAYQALAAALGGVQTLATSSYDEALGLPSEEAVTVALRTQQILAYETGVARTVDPLGGSYYVETLTHELEQRIMAEIDRVEKLGGAVAAIELGYYQRAVSEGAYRIQRAIESGERVLVGVNRFTEQRDAESFRPFRVNPDSEREQIARLQRHRAERDPARVRRALDRVQQDAQHDRNLVPAILEAVRCYATIGEICGALRAVWGDFRQAATYVV